MNMDFLSSSVGQYIVQTILHSTIIAIIVETILSSWHIRKPLPQIKFRFLALALPVLYLPVFYLLYPPRASSYFRQQSALFDFNQWMEIRIGGNVSLWHLFVAVLALTVGFFLVKEAIPVIRHYLSHRLTFPVMRRGEFPKLDVVLANLTNNGELPYPIVLASTTDTPAVYTLGSRTLVLSAATINILDMDELEAVIAHELAHFTRWVVNINRASLLLRFVLFYNPIALLVFRRIIHDNEKLCDDIAVAVTGKRLALASGLLKVFRHTATEPSPTHGNGLNVILSPRVSALEDIACRELVKERVTRILHPDEAGIVPYQNYRFLVTAGMLMALLFFVV